MYLGEQSLRDDMKVLIEAHEFVAEEMFDSDVRTAQSYLIGLREADRGNHTYLYRMVCYLSKADLKLRQKSLFTELENQLAIDLLDEYEKLQGPCSPRQNPDLND